MKKINIIKENDEYNRIIKKYKAYKFNNYIIYIEYNTKEVYKFGFSVGKKIGNAVTRNKIKRRLKAILDKIPFKNNFKCIIIVKKGILDKTFVEMQNELKEAVQKLNIIKENVNEKDI